MSLSRITETPQPTGNRVVISTGNEGGYKTVRLAYARPFEVVWDGGGYYATEEEARQRAQQLADAAGAPIRIYDRSQKTWLAPVQPAQHLCPNRACRREISAAEFALARKNHRCSECSRPDPEVPCG